MHSIHVFINDVLVHTEICRPDISIMRAHHLKRIYLIDDLVRNSIVCGVCVLKDDGSVYSTEKSDLTGNELTVQSAMNNADFEEKPGPWDAYFKQHNTKNDDD